MTSLSTAAGLRDRAAKCRELAAGPITQPGAAAWLDLATRWERLADSVEASAFRAAMTEETRLPATGADPPLLLRTADASE
jgi:hypothetical protein